MKSSKIEVARDTCTACAGTMILEFGALSRLSGEPVFEVTALISESNVHQLLISSCLPSVGCTQGDGLFMAVAPPNQ